MDEAASTDPLHRRIEELEREVEDLRHGLAEARATTEALEAGEVDAVVNRSGGGALLVHAAQAALQASEERYRNIVTTSEEGIGTVDVDMVITFANDRLASMLGTTAEVMTGRPLLDFVDASSQEAARQSFERRRQGLRERREVALRRKDGAVLWASVAASPLLDPDGRFAGSLWMVTDITEQRQAEEVRARLVAIVESSEDAIFAKSLDGTILTWNAGAQALFGYRPEEAIGQSVELLVPPEGRAELSHTLDRLRTGHSVSHLETVRRRKDGAAVFVSLSISPLRDADGHVTGASTIARDVTESRRAEEARKQLERRFRLMVEHSADGIALLTADGVFTYVSPSAEGIIGRSQEELLGHRVYEYVLPEDVPRLAEVAARRGAEGSVDHLEFRYAFPDGTVRWIESSSVNRLSEVGIEAIVGTFRDVTERHRLEEERRSSVERFRTIFRASPAAIAIGRGGAILDANDRYCEFFGYGREELLGKTVQELGLWVDPSDRARMMEEIRAQGSVRDFSTTFRRKDGTIRDALMAVEPLKAWHDGESSVDGTEPTLLIMVVDVTERKRVETELRESRAFLEQAQAIGHIGSWVSDPGEHMRASEEAQRIFGVAGIAFEGRFETILALIHPDDRAAVRAALSAALHGGQPYSMEHRIVRPDGAVRLVHAEAQVVHDEAGHPVKMVGIVQDITERKAAEVHLQEGEERYRVLFDESPMPMWAYDPESLRIVMANQAAAAQYGYTTEELVTLSLPAIRPPEVNAEGIRAINLAMPPGRQSTGVFKHRRKDGSLLDVDVHLNDVNLGGRRLKLAVLHDVTQRRSLEEQLRQSQKMEAVGRLAGGVAHDFNNLLTVILGYSDILANRFHVGDSERAEIQEIRRAGERAATLTRQLLAFSRKQLLVPETLDLGSVVRGVLRMLERLIGEDITVSLVVAPDLGRVLADPGQMEQVVMNLSVNARDAMPKGGELLIELRNVDIDAAYASAHLGATPGPHVLLAVTDTGLGMAPEVLKQIFEPFFTTKPMGEGTGLGLSTVFGIVSQSGGTIWVESEPGHGTTFEIYLPRIAAVTVTPRMASGSVPTLAGSGTILLVEDEEQLRRLAKRVLELRRYTVLEARNGADALRVVREHAGAIDLLLTDVVMPGMSGPDLAAIFQRERPGVPVLYMSGYTDDAVVRSGLVSAGTQFLQKPFTPKLLAQRVQEALRLRAP